MRLLVFATLAALLLATPLALAGLGDKVPPLDQNGVTVGPCFAGWSFYWPGDNLWVGCTVGDQTLVFVCWSGALETQCGFRTLP